MGENPYVVVYTDGSCRRNPGPGGWGILIRCGVEEEELYGGEEYTTNNRMELMAVIKAIEYIKEPKHITIYTDSEYVERGINNRLSKHRRMEWKMGNGKPIKNADLWMKLDKVLAGRKQVFVKWVRGHNGNKGNERADKLAKLGVDRMTKDHLCEFSQRAIYEKIKAICEE